MCIMKMTLRLAANNTLKKTNPTYKGFLQAKAIILAIAHHFPLQFIEKSRSTTLIILLHSSS